MQKHPIHSYCISATTKMWTPESKSGPTYPQFKTHQPPPYANFLHHKLMQTLPNPPIRKSTTLEDLVEFKVMKAFKAHNIFSLWHFELKKQKFELNHHSSFSFPLIEGLIVCGKHFCFAIITFISKVSWDFLKQFNITDK